MFLALSKRLENHDDLTISSCSFSEALPEMWIRAKAADADANVHVMLGNVGVHGDGDRNRLQDTTGELVALVFLIVNGFNK